MPQTAEYLIGESAKIWPELVLVFYAFILLVLSAFYPREKRSQLGYWSLFAVILTLVVTVKIGLSLDGGATAPAFSGQFLPWCSAR